MVWSLRVHLPSVQLPRQSDGKVAYLNDFLDFPSCLGQDLAVFEADQARQVFLALAERLAKSANDLAAPWRSYFAPQLERVLGAAYRLVIARLASRPDPRQDLARGRIDRLDDLTVTRRADGTAEGNACCLALQSEGIENGGPGALDCHHGRNATVRSGWVCHNA